MKKDKEGVTQVPAESENTNHAAYARSEFASPPSKKSLSQDGEKVNNDYISKEASSQEENASFFDDYNSEKRVPKINQDEVIEGIWEDSPNKSKNVVEKSQLESVENLSDDDIIRMAKEYLRSPEGKRDKRPYLRHRPSFGKNQEQIVYDNGKNIFGNVYDPSGAKVPWDPSRPRKGQWDMGHIPGQKYSVIHARYVNEMMTPMEFAQWYRDPRNYRPELPSTNRSHKYE